jgi:hypothetical protein
MLVKILVLMGESKFMLQMLSTKLLTELTIESNKSD